MFLNLQRFTRLMKEAYKTKLIIGNLSGGTLITSGYWAVWLDNEHIPNKVKAAIMELAGELPVEGTVFEISKGMIEPQLVMDATYIKRLFIDVEEVDLKLVVTPVVLHNTREMRLLQSTQTKELVALNEEFYLMIDKTAINYDIEGEPTGPCCISTSSSIHWYNSICMVLIFPILMKDNAILENLRTVNFEDEGGK